MDRLITYAIPGFIILILIEVFITAREKADWYETKDAFSSISMGLGNVFVGIIGKILVLLFFDAAYQVRFFDLQASWLVFIALFFADDISYYFFHRASHEIRYFWASHVVHHSSQKYNLTTALRQTWTGTLSGSFLFWIWLPFLGFRPEWVMSMMSISLLYQFWIHTEAIDRLPRFFEYVFNTPSHHRVHHGSDPLYLDRNHGGILIIWDRLFGTFQEELYRPHYGLVKNINTYNPLIIAFGEWGNILKDVWKAPTFTSALKYMFAMPGYSHDGSRMTSDELRDRSLAQQSNDD